MSARIFSHSFSATGRVFHLSELLPEENSVVIITDKAEDKELLFRFGPKIFHREVSALETLEQVWNIQPQKKVYIVHPHLLEISGSIDYLRRTTALELARDMKDTLEELIERLLSFGYTHKEYLDDPGTYKREGSILTVTHPYSNIIIQIEYFDTEIDSIILLDRGQNTRTFVDSYILPGVISHSFERSEGVLNPSLLALLPRDRVIIGCDFLEYIDVLSESASVHFTDFYREGSISLSVEPLSIAHIDELQVFLRENLSIANIRIYTRFPKPIREFLSFHNLAHLEVTEVGKLSLESCQMPVMSYELGVMSDMSGKLTFEGRVRGGSVFSGDGKRSPTRELGDDTIEIDFEGPPDKGGRGVLIHGKQKTENRKQRTIIITDDILSPIFVRDRSKKSIAKHLDLLLQIQPGDYVVHRDHGIARFESLVIKNLSNIRREYLELHYAEGDRLFVPLTEIYRVSKYVGEIEPTLTRLEGKEWERVMEKTDEELEQIASELIEIGAKRTLAKGIRFGRFDDEELFRKAFHYTHTHDQLEAIEDIRRDMEDELPMDRLLSGDVGFGKTEVAMNALYKAVLSGYQCAVISPLLVLADEHYETFTERLGVFGVRIACMTRMTTPKEEKHILAGLKEGGIDIVVGTHKLLSDDIRFAKLGLLVIDEEHKFGVSHKEKLKKLRANIDILSLSATPIPRSLNLALSGLRKISVLSTPPAKKKSIETIVTRWNESTIAHAIDFELGRGGQVIIIHNRIGSLEQVEREITDIVMSYKLGVMSKRNKIGIEETGNRKQKTENRKPATVKIISTHGRMSGDDIEDRIHAFKKQEYDILLTTTIIENGVNFLSANTIIILDPEQFGLAQLHQLRGRVGRKDVQGYCYLIYRKPELATDEKERIVTIANNSHLGAGFEIAMRDMEIRGAGEVLGFKQAGKSKEVGLSLYFRLLEEKIEDLKNERKKRAHIKIELDLSYSIPDDFFSGELDKLSFFRDIESVETLEGLEEIEKELLQDRLIENHKREQGDAGIYHLFLLLRARLILAEHSVTSLKRIGDYYVFDCEKGMKPEKMRTFLERFDPKKNMALLSIEKVRVETKHYKGARELLESLV